MIAVLHIAGAVFVMLVLGLGLTLLGAWIDRDNGKRALNDASLALAVPLSELSSPSMEKELIKHLGARYSEDLLVNRLSDLVGVLLAAFGWIITLIQLGLLVFVAWISYSESQDNAVYAWLIIPITLVASAINLGVYYICKLLTGRFPSQARSVRKMLGESINRLSVA